MSELSHAPMGRLPIINLQPEGTCLGPLAGVLPYLLDGERLLACGPVEPMKEGLEYGAFSERDGGFIALHLYASGSSTYLPVEGLPPLPIACQSDPDRAGLWLGNLAGRAFDELLARNVDDAVPDIMYGASELFSLPFAPNSGLKLALVRVAPFPLQGSHGEMPDTFLAFTTTLSWADLSRKVRQFRDHQVEKRFHGLLGRATSSLKKELSNM